MNRLQRTKTMDEILNGIKILKLYSWERSFQEKASSDQGDQIGRTFACFL
jgi:hypothetical protein